MTSICYLMRGLPSTGKTFTAKQLAGESGMVCETDEYFYSHVGDDPECYDFDESLMAEARAWNFERFKKAVDFGVSPIVVDRGNGLTLETQRYARYAHEAGYQLEIAEPSSTWWTEIRVLLKYRPLTLPILRAWAKRLAEISLGTHRVSADEIWSRVHTWRYGLTVGDILSFDPSAEDKEEANSSRANPSVKKPDHYSNPEAIVEESSFEDGWLRDVLVTQAPPEEIIEK